MFVAFMPYPTLVLAARLSDSAGGGTVLATVLYGANMTAIAVMFNVIWLYASARNGHLLRRDIDDEIRRVGARGYQYAPFGYLIVTLIAFLSPLLSLGLYLAYAVYWILPISGPLSGRSP
jgi:hypothetical protein